MDWLSGTNPYRGAMAPQKGFPSILPLSEATDWVTGSGPAEVVLGVDALGQPIRVDLDAESPHVLISAPTGRGKSAIARSIAMQRLAVGDVCVFLDVKRHSHRWAKGLDPVVHYARDIHDIGGTLVNLGREVHRRNHVVDNWDGPIETAPVGPRIVVVYEEMNATMAALRSLGKRLHDGDYSAQDALSDVSFMGRAVKVHLVSFAQMATWKASGGAEIIENYGTRILIGHSATTWRYLASDCGKLITAPEETGRGIVVQRGRAIESQLLWVPEESARNTVLASPEAQRRARQMVGGRRNLPAAWRAQVGR